MAQHILVTIDGAVLDPDVPFLHADDLAAIRGDALFESLLVRDGRARNVGRHLDRLAAGAADMELPAPDRQQWTTAVETAARTWTKENDGAEGFLRLVYSRGRESVPGATGYVTVGPLSPRVAGARRDGIDVITLPRGFSVDLKALAPWQLLGVKSVSYATNMAALRYAAKQGVDDVVFLSSEGTVLEGPRSSVVVVRNGGLVTTPSRNGVLVGTTQQSLFDVAASRGIACSEQTLRPADLVTADEVWLLSSITLGSRVNRIDGFELVHRRVPFSLAELVEEAIAD